LQEATQCNSLVEMFLHIVPDGVARANAASGGIE
jgi:hypothetical protein